MSSEFCSNILSKVNPYLKSLDLEILFIGDLVKIWLFNCMHALLYGWQQQPESDMKSKSCIYSYSDSFSLRNNEIYIKIKWNHDEFWWFLNILKDTFTLMIDFQFS